jgi:hypothetical protein
MECLQKFLTKKCLVPLDPLIEVGIVAQNVESM